VGKNAQNSDKNSEGRRRRIQTLEPFRWRTGQSGNPGGRPKRKPITEAYNEILAAIDPKTGMTGAQILALEAFKKAVMDGNPTLIKEITDRVEGTVKQTLDVLFGDMKDDDIAKLIEELFAAEGAGADGGEATGDGPGADPAGSTGEASSSE